MFGWNINVNCVRKHDILRITRKAGGEAHYSLTIDGIMSQSSQPSLLVVLSSEIMWETKRLVRIIRPVIVSPSLRIEGVHMCIEFLRNRLD